jgi:hypothetical protein
MDRQSLLGVLIRVLGLFFLLNGAVSIVTVLVITDFGLTQQLTGPVLTSLAGVLLLARADVLAKSLLRDRDSGSGSESS